MRKVRIGIVGCGNISRVYIKNLNGLFQNTEVAAVCDIDAARARAAADEFGIGRVLSLEQMISDESVELVVNLTTPQQHYAIARQVLEGGKHVYLEKPLSLTYTEAGELVALAKGKNVLLGCAPDTFLGAGYQTARHALDSGLIGTVVSASTFDVNHGHEGWHPDPAYFYEAGGGPVFDRGPYNFTALVSLIGPARVVAGMTSRTFPQRTITSQPKFGEKIDVEVPTHVSGTVEFENGAICIATLSYDVWGTALPHTELHGTLGSLILPDTNSFTGDVLYKPYFAGGFEKLPHTHIYSENCRGLGAADMAAAILAGGVPRANGEMACHVVEIMEALHESWERKEYIALKSRCQRPEPLPMGLNSGFVC